MKVEFLYLAGQENMAWRGFNGPFNHFFGHQNGGIGYNRNPFFPAQLQSRIGKDLNTNLTQDVYCSLVDLSESGFIHQSELTPIELGCLHRYFLSDN
jgi:hypothetical protein